MGKTPKHGFWFKVGLVLLVLNFPIGYGGLAVGTAIAVCKKQPAALTVGFVFYGLSWVILGLGTILTGRGGIRYAKSYWRERCRRRITKPPAS